jgi:hypothetical protein
MSDSVKPNDAQQPDTTAPPVAVVVIPVAGLTDELRAYLSLRRDALIQELRWRVGRCRRAEVNSGRGHEATAV